MATRTLHRRPLAWPFRMFGWFVVGVLALAVLAGATVIGAGTYYEFNRTKAADMEALIETELPRGVMSEQILAVLDSEGIEHGPVAPFSGDDRKLLEMGVAKGTMIISGSVRNDGYSLDLVDVEMRFILDQELKLADYVVYETHRRP